MNGKIRILLAQISLLERDLRKAEQEEEQETGRLSHIESKKTVLEEPVLPVQCKFRHRLFRWIETYRPQNFITGPIIYSMILPLLFLDLCVTIYQATCFPIYRITKVKRSDYIVFDRQQLQYLNLFQKFHCTYCAYGNGLIAYVEEIAARTEQYFCPIKHGRKVLGTHAHYKRFLEFGEASEYATKLENFRSDLQSSSTDQAE